MRFTQLSPTLCDPMDCSLPVSSVYGILQARILEWVAIPSPGDLPNPGREPRSPALQADPLPAELPGKSKNRRDVLISSFLQPFTSGWGHIVSNKGTLV